jgi:hypothetical protein
MLLSVFCDFFFLLMFCLNSLDPLNPCIKTIYNGIVTLRNHAITAARVASYMHHIATAHQCPRPRFRATSRQPRRRRRRARFRGKRNRNCSCAPDVGSVRGRRRGRPAEQRAGTRCCTAGAAQAQGQRCTIWLISDVFKDQHQV